MAPNSNIKSWQSTLERLEGSLAGEVAIMRELLSSLKMEQQVLLNNDTAHLSAITKEREPIMAEIGRFGDHRVAFINQLMRELKIDARTVSEGLLDIIVRYLDADAVGIMSQRDQLRAISKQVQELNESNTYLLKSKLHYTKELMRGLHPEDKNPMYGPAGQTARKNKIATITLINEEG